MSLYNTWKEYSDMPEDLLIDLNNMDQEMIDDAFFGNLEFGTGGLRGLLGAGTNRLNIFTIQRVTLGLAKYLVKKYEGQDITVAIGYDSRHKSVEFSECAAQVLATFGIKTLIYDDVKPTPMLSYLVRNRKCQAGIMITASHNPKEYNGYKVYNEDGAQLDLEQSDEVIKLVNEVENTFNTEFLKDYKDYVEYINEDFDEELNPSSLIIKNDNTLTYVVKKGDTLYQIAKKHATTVEEIQLLNKLTTTTIQINQILKIK